MLLTHGKRKQKGVRDLYCFFLLLPQHTGHTRCLRKSGYWIGIGGLARVINFACSSQAGTGKIMQSSLNHHSLILHEPGRAGRDGTRSISSMVPESGVMDWCEIKGFAKMALPLGMRLSWRVVWWVATVWTFVLLPNPLKSEPSVCRNAWNYRKKYSFSVSFISSTVLERVAIALEA